MQCFCVRCSMWLLWEREPERKRERLWERETDSFEKETQKKRERLRERLILSTFPFLHFQDLFWCLHQPRSSPGLVAVAWGWWRTLLRHSPDGGLCPVLGVAFWNARRHITGTVNRFGMGSNTYFLLLWVAFWNAYYQIVHKMLIFLHRSTFQNGKTGPWPSNMTPDPSKWGWYPSTISWQTATPPSQPLSPPQTTTWPETSRYSKIMPYMLFFLNLIFNWSYVSYRWLILN